MTLRFVESFDHYATADLLEKWTAVDSNISGQAISAGNGRRGTNAFSSTTTGRGLVRAVPAHATYTIGAALNLASNGIGSQTTFFEFRELGSIHLQMRLNTDLSVTVRRNTTTLATSAAGVIPANGFSYIEFKATVNDTTGAYEVRVNGATVLSGSGADTRDGGTGVVTTIALLHAANNSYIDDVYICDGAGSANTTFLGDVRVDAGLPNANGNSSQLLGSDGNSTNNYQLVDETPPNDDTDYVGSATASQKDTYGFPNMLHTPSSIFGVQVSINAKKDDAGLRSVCSVTRSGGSDTDGATQALGTSYVYFLEVLENDPNTAAAWTQSGYNAAEFGLKVAA
jgi:hypothetical protein